LSAAELLAALAAKVGDKEVNEENLVNIDEAIGICASLVTEDCDRSIIRLIHYTTNEFFTQSGAGWIAKSSECIASTCLTYLSFQTFLSGPCKDALDLEAKIAQHPLATYAADYWVTHTYHCQEHE
jgi:hypothetical protein